ncbi:retron St85 family RNA-directed DNA polymerase [Shewanella sp. 10N.286.45.A1]|uniref:retron St85 family RNA-directed DNA polymerase n=1 Tax=Shewanella sp. 10N.286.45.A1 TaxID=3229694 RepID=UPI0035541F63
MSILKKLSCKLKASEQDVLRVAVDAPMKYKIYTIPKRTQGRRTIAHPAKELKVVQSALVELFQLPVHNNAMAYKKGTSIKENASVHKNNKYLLKMDFENFFNSITPSVFWNTWKQQHREEPDFFDKKIVNNILFWAKEKFNKTELVLSVGAPSSPAISNFCLFYFDKEITQLCKNNNISFTRYADDLTFSTNEKNSLFDIPKVIAATLNKHYGTKISINNQKTIFSSKAHNKHVTGITITPEGNLSIGRERKRYIKHLVHQFKIDNLDEVDLNHLRGLLSFSGHIEPKFIESLSKKYSKDTIDRITRGHNETTQ